MKQWGQFGPKFQVQGVIHHQPCQKTRMIDLSYGIKMWAKLSFVLSQFTRLTDGQMDGRTDGYLAHGYTQLHTCSMVKSYNKTRNTNVFYRYVQLENMYIKRV